MRCLHQQTQQCGHSSTVNPRGPRSMPVYFIVSLFRLKLRNISSTSLSSISDSVSVIQSRELTVGRPNDGAQTTSLSLLAPAWKTVRLSCTSPLIIPFGTAKYLMSELIRPWYGVTYFLLMNFLTFFLSTCCSLGLRGGGGRRNCGPLSMKRTRTPPNAWER